MQLGSAVSLDAGATHLILCLPPLASTEREPYVEQSRMAKERYASEVTAFNSKQQQWLLHHGQAPGLAPGLLDAAAGAAGGLLQPPSQPASPSPHSATSGGDLQQLQHVLQHERFHALQDILASLNKQQQEAAATHAQAQAQAQADAPAAEALAMAAAAAMTQAQLEGGHAFQQYVQPELPTLVQQQDDTAAVEVAGPTGEVLHLSQLLQVLAAAPPAVVTPASGLTAEAQANLAGQLSAPGSLDPTLPSPPGPPQA